MCIKPSPDRSDIYQQTSEPIDCQSDCMKYLVTDQQTNNSYNKKLVSPLPTRTMPKRYHPYQSIKKETRERAPKVVCKSVGANGTIFIVKDNDTSSESSETVVVKNEVTEDIVDVERCDDEIILGSRQSVVQNVNHLQENGSASDKPAEDPVAYAAFVTILIHALKCSGLCEKPACRKMTLVLKHYKACAFKRNTLNSTGGWSSSVKNCKICSQLLKIVSFHSKAMCKMPATQMGCPVLMCDAFRFAASSSNASIEQLNKMKMMMMRKNDNTAAAPELNKLAIQPKAGDVTTTRIPTARRANARPVCGARN